MAAPALKSLYKRELLVAPKPAFAIAGCAELHTFIAERIRDKIKLTGSVPSVPDFPQLLGANTVISSVIYSKTGTLLCDLVIMTRARWVLCSLASSQEFRAMPHEKQTEDDPNPSTSYAMYQGQTLLCAGLSEEDPLATSPRASSTQAKKYLRADLFSYYQRVKPGVCLALIPMCVHHARICVSLGWKCHSALSLHSSADGARRPNHAQTFLSAS